MTRQYGIEFSERPLMSTISDLLGIRHFTTSSGGTVRKDFLLAVADAMGIDASPTTSKDDLISMLWEHANQTEMPENRLSRGGTVTNTVLQEIIDGITEHGIGRSTAPPLAEDNDFASLQDERRRVLRATAVREGQDLFRRDVLTAYRERCAVTDTSVPATLEAAHIVPYRGPHSNDVRNGLCLRSDIHVLFDRGLLAIHEDDYSVRLSEVLHTSAPYADLEGRIIALPLITTMRPSAAALRSHREWAGL